MVRISLQIACTSFYVQQALVLVLFKLNFGNNGPQVKAVFSIPFGFARRLPCKSFVVLVLSSQDISTRQQSNEYSSRWRYQPWPESCALCMLNVHSIANDRATTNQKLTETGLSTWAVFMVSLDTEGRQSLPPTVPEDTSTQLKLGEALCGSNSAGKYDDFKSNIAQLLRCPSILFFVVHICMHKTEEDKQEACKHRYDEDWINERNPD